MTYEDTGVVVVERFTEGDTGGSIQARLMRPFSSAPGVFDREIMPSGVSFDDLIRPIGIRKVLHSRAVEAEYEVIRRYMGDGPRDANEEVHYTSWSYNKMLKLRSDSVLSIYKLLPVARDKAIAEMKLLAAVEEERMAECKDAAMEMVLEHLRSKDMTDEIVDLALGEQSYPIMMRDLGVYDEPQSSNQSGQPICVMFVYHGGEDLDYVRRVSGPRTRTGTSAVACRRVQ